MEYRLLGSSGCAVSALALGSLTFGNETDQAASFSQLDRFTEAGGNLVDSADVYADGRADVSLSCSPRRAGSPPMRARTGMGCPCGCP